MAGPGIDADDGAGRGSRQSFRERVFVGCRIESGAGGFANVAHCGLKACRGFDAAADVSRDGSSSESGESAVEPGLDAFEPDRFALGVTDQGAGPGVVRIQISVEPDSIFHDGLLAAWIILEDEKRIVLPIKKHAGGIGIAFAGILPDKSGVGVAGGGPFDQISLVIFGPDQAIVALLGPVDQDFPGGQVRSISGLVGRVHRVVVDPVSGGDAV